MSKFPNSFVFLIVLGILYTFILCKQTSDPYCVLEKDGLKIMVFQNKKLAKEHYPELRIETDNIDEVFEKVSSSHPHLLHPNLNKVTLRPWGAKEFAIADKQVGIRFQQW